VKTINVDQIVQILISISHDMEETKDLLNELDGAMGDGDLGITMSHGYRAVREGLADYPQDIGRILFKMGMDFNNAAASTTGALRASALLRASKLVKGKIEINLSDIAAIYKAAEDGIREKGKANLGDKTMLEAIVPARMALEEASQAGEPIVQAFRKAVERAEEGMKSTVAMQSAIGRAKWLGERTIGLQDPGATAIFLELKAALAALERLVESQGESA
jgi:phosphoenolpyruvate---glycerone phosphotransferase subunit DhaL